MLRANPSLFTTAAFFCTIAVILLSVALGSSPSVSALSADEKKNLTDNLKFFETYLKNSINDAKTQLATTGTSCSIANYACNPYKDVPKINFTGDDGYIPAEYGHVQPKEWIGQDYTTDTEIQKKACQLSLMGPQWLKNYNDSSKQVLYQYFTYPDNFFGVYPQSPWNCSATYTPTERPFYTSSAVGQKDVIILFDASTKASDSTWRINMQKKIAEKVVRSLSFKDYVAVIPFGDSPDEQINLMSQSTEGNQNTILDSIKTIEAMPNNGTNIGAAISRAFDVFATSRGIGLSSDCSRVVILLTQGVNNFNVPQPGTALSNNRDALLFPILVSQNPSDASVTLMDQLSCASATITRNVTHDNVKNITATLEAMNLFFSSVQATTVLRYSEVYEDALGQGQILSLSAPVYTKNSIDNDVFSGVITVDVPLAGVIKTMTSITASQVTNFLLESTVCTPLNHRGSRELAVVNKLQEGKCQTVQTEKIGFRTTAEGEELPINKAMPGIIVGSVFFILIIFGVGFYLNEKNDDNSYSYEKLGPMIALIAFLVCWIICIPIMFSLVAPDLVEVNNFVKTQLTLSSTTGTPFRCCELSSCSSCTHTTDASCATEIPRLTNDAAAGNGPHECGNGHYCCNWRSYECNCRSTCSSSSSKSGSSRSCSRSCSTCRECVQSVSNRLCYISCGTCYSMNTKFRYRYPGETGDLYQSQWSKVCTLQGAENCKNQWIAEHPVPSLRDGWVNPEDPIDVRREVKVRQPPFIAFMVFACLSIPILIYAYYVILKEFFKEDDSSARGGSTFNWGSSGSDNKGAAPAPVEMDKTTGGLPNHFDNSGGGGFNNTSASINNNGYDNNNDYYHGQGAPSGAQTYPPPGHYNNQLPPVQAPPTYPMNNNAAYPMNNTTNGDNAPPPAGGYSFAPIGTGGMQQPMYSSPTGPGNNNNTATNMSVPPPTNAGGIQGI